MKVWVAVAVAREADTFMVGVGQTKALAEAKLVANLKARWRDLKVDQTFDFVSGGTTGVDSFFDYCKKTGARTYRSLNTGQDFKVGTINVQVYHVDTWPASRWQRKA